MTRDQALAVAETEFSSEALANRGLDGFPLLYIRNKYKGSIRADLAKSLDHWLSHALTLHLAGLIDSSAVAGVKAQLWEKLIAGIKDYKKK